MWFWSKTRTVNEMIRISKAIDMHSKNLADRLEELDQEKVYLCSMPEATMEQVKIVRDAFSGAGKQMRWTMPKILFTNTSIKIKKRRSVKKK